MAMSSGTPSRVNPEMKVASITPMPPGTGDMPPKSEATVQSTMSDAKEAEPPTERRAAQSASALRNWVRIWPPMIRPTLAGSARMARRLAHAACISGRNLALTTRRILGMANAMAPTKAAATARRRTLNRISESEPGAPAVVVENISHEQQRDTAEDDLHRESGQAVEDSRADRSSRGHAPMLIEADDGGRSPGRPPDKSAEVRGRPQEGQRSEGDRGRSRPGQGDGLGQVGQLAEKQGHRVPRAIAPSSRRPRCWPARPAARSGARSAQKGHRPAGGGEVLSRVRGTGTTGSMSSAAAAASLSSAHSCLRPARALRPPPWATTSGCTGKGPERWVSSHHLDAAIHRRGGVGPACGLDQEARNVGISRLGRGHDLAVRKMSETGTPIGTEHDLDARAHRRAIPASSSVRSAVHAASNAPGVMCGASSVASRTPSGGRPHEAASPSGWRKRDAASTVGPSTPRLCAQCRMPTTCSTCSAGRKFSSSVYRRRQVNRHSRAMNWPSGTRHAHRRRRRPDPPKRPRPGSGPPRVGRVSPIP